MRVPTLIRLAASTAGLVLLAAPAVAGGASLRRIPLAAAPAAARTPAATWRILPPLVVHGSFRLAGVHWRGAGRVELELRSALGRGRYSAWQPLDEADGPPASDGAPGGEHASEPAWVDHADRLQVRYRGAPRHLVALLVDPGANPRSVPIPRTVQARPSGPPPQPVIISRAQWGADESLRRSGPSYASRLRVAFVHHTDTPNGYSAADAPAIVRAIYIFHVRGNGWNDIGYNFLVDAYGRIYEGRHGGIGENVIGAHTGGFNTGAVGVALIGTFQHDRPSEAALASLRALLAWRLDVGHVDPTASGVRLKSGGNSLFPRGRVVSFRAISGHRDAGSTDCPGNVAYGLLPAIRAGVAEVGGLRIWSPALAPARIVPTTGGIVPIRFTATLSAPAPWRVVVATTSGRQVALLRGGGATIDATWSGRVNGGGPLPAAESLRWRVEAGSGAASARAAQGAFDGSGAPAGEDVGGDTASPAVRVPIAAPAAITPNGDGVDDVGTLTWHQTLPASVEVDVVDATGATVRVLTAPTGLQAGQRSVRWDARAASGVSVPSGHYAYVLRVRLANQSTITPVEVPVDVRRGVRDLRLGPAFVSPNGDGVDDAAALSFTLVEPGDVAVRVRGADGHQVATIANLTGVPAGFRFSYRFEGGGLRNGRYVLDVIAPGAGGVLVLSAPIAIDTVAPRVRLRSIVRRGRFVRVVARLSESGRIEARVGRRLLFAGPYPSGLVRLRFSLARLAGARRVVLYVGDRAGNVGRVLVRIPRG